MANRFRYKFVFTFIFLFFLPQKSIAGPPFNTDDPEPVDFLHWEFYVASVFQFEQNNDNATLPHIEINYGAVPNLQLHVLTGMGYVREDSEHQYGFMTAELGIKYRFFNDEVNDLQIGVFPLAELPTTRGNGLVGNNNLQIFLPLWVQKGWGKLVTYGGGGYWINPGENNVNWIFTGWECQYDFSETLTLGGEVFYQTKNTNDGTSDLTLKLGGFININKENHILFSVGHSLRNQHLLSGYIGYQMTI